MSIRERFVIDVDDKIRFRDWNLESETVLSVNFTSLITREKNNAGTSCSCPEVVEALKLLAVISNFKIFIL